MQFRSAISRAALGAVFLGLLPVVTLAADTAAPAWPQANSDIPADAAVRFGALPNGMRYAIMKNATPKGEVSLRFRIGSGSMQESDAQQGLAHFLEHMAYRGSTHVPTGDVFAILQRLGLRAGADANAFTAQTETVYQFDLPRTDDETIETGLMLARDIASELSLKPDSMDAERGPVLSEERLRDGPGNHAFLAQNKFIFKGQRAPERIPIGKVEVIRAAPVAELADYYHAFYRPERAALVVVGDIDPDAMEAKIKAKFADWNGVGQGRADPDFGTPLTRGQEQLVFAEADAPQFATVSWVAPYDNTPDSAERRKRNRIEGVALGILNQRFAQVAQNANAPFLGAGVSRGNSVRSARIASLRVNYAGDGWQKALEEAEKLRRQVVAQGVTQQEIDRQVTTSLTGAETALASASTRQSRQLAAGLADTLDRDAVFNSPETGIALIQADLKGLTADTVNAALRAAFTGNGPLLFLSSPKPVEGGEMTLASVFNRAESAPLDNAVAPQLAVWPYTNFGTPGTVAETRKIADLDTTFIRFANGVKLTVKPTKFSANQVLVTVGLAGGELALPKDRKVINTGAYLGGGLEALPFLDIRRSLTGKIYSIGFSVDDDAFYLSGATRPADLDTELQVLTAFVTAPGWRPDSFQQGLRSLTDNLAKIDATPMSVFGSRWSGLLHTGDARWMTPTPTEVERASFDDVKAIIAPALANSPIEVTIVGDISLEQATQAVAATFGALPPRPNSPYAAPRLGDVKFPAPTSEPLVFYHTGRADQGVAAIAWPTTDVFADNESAARRIVTDILQLRLFDQLRVADGATYSPQVNASASTTFPGYGYIAAIAEIPPDKRQLFYDAVTKITADLREHPPTQDEFDRARRPELEGLDRAVETNGFWSSSLSGAQADERMLDLIRLTRPRLEQVTPEDVQRVARKYLSDDRALKLVVQPKP